MSTQIYIVDDNVAFCTSLKWLLSANNRQSTVFNSAEDFLQNYDGKKGCVLLDVRMEGMDGISLLSELKNSDFALETIIITGHANVGMAVNAMKLGAFDFIEKPFDDEILLNLINSAEISLTQKLKNIQNKQQTILLWQTLTKREKDIAKQAINGKSTKEIADFFDISVKTVEIHRSRILKKIEARNIAELVSKLSAIIANLD